jgi:hypothetical protein
MAQEVKILKELDEMRGPKKLSSVKILIILLACGVVAILLSWQFSMIPKVAAPVPTQQKTPVQYANEYHAPTAPTSGFPKELLVEKEIVNESVSFFNQPAPHITYTYTSKNKAADSIVLYKNSLNSNGWNVTTENPTSLQATKENSEIKSIAITAKETSSGSQIQIVIEYKK